MKFQRREIYINMVPGTKVFLRMDGRSVNIASVVEELFFKDQYLEHLCHVGLTKQLTRTADGGNDAIRVKELAEMVKALRKAVQSYQKKLQELLQSVDRPPESDQNEAGIQTGLLANIETQTSPQANNLGTVSCNQL